MSVPINIRIKIVLPMAKFGSPIFVKRKLQAECGKNIPTEVCIAATFEEFSETGTVNIEDVWEGYQKLHMIKWKMFMVFAQMNLR